jgi:hypothetical protein
VAVGRTKTRDFTNPELFVTVTLILSDAYGMRRDTWRSGHSTISLIVASLVADDAALLPPQPPVTVLTTGTTKDSETTNVTDDISLLVVLINMFFLPMHRQSPTAKTYVRGMNYSNKAS